MSNVLTWEQSETTLRLSGTLNRESILAFWESREPLLTQIDQVDVSALQHVDSTGLAMLVRLQGEFDALQRPLQIVGMSDNLTTLMELYGVQAFFIN